MYWKLILEFVDSKSDLHHACVMVDNDILSLSLVDNDLVCFYERLL